MASILPLLNVLSQEFEKESGAFLSQSPDLEGRGDGGFRLQDFSPAGGDQQAVKNPGHAEKEKRRARDLKPGMPENGKTRNDQPCDDLPFAALGAHGHPGGRRIGQLIYSVSVIGEEENGLIRGEEGSQAEKPSLRGNEADKFLLALPQHRAGNFGVGTHRVVLEPDTFALLDPAADQGAAQVQDALFALPLKGPLGNIASRPFIPERGDVRSQPFC